MSIRTVNKNHLRSFAEPVSLVSTTRPTGQDDPLRFWTRHPKRPVLVDLTEFRDGQATPPKGTWGGGYSGRPKLIAELAPALREITLVSSDKTIGQVKTSLRTWWRVFDDMEASARASGQDLRVSSVADITDLHRQVAFDSGLTRAAYSGFARALDLTRRALCLRPLHWVGPEQNVPTRHLPSFSQVKPVRDALKRDWYAALDRWARVDELRAGASPASQEEQSLLYNCTRLLEAAQTSGNAWPTGEELLCGRSPSFRHKEGFCFAIAAHCIFPDAWDIRAAFHLCLATTGWNPATFIGLHVDEPFLEVHPRDESRYLLTGYKERARTCQVTEGLLKSQRSPGVILQTLMQRTAPLRVQLRDRHAAMLQEMERLLAEDAEQADVDALRKGIINIEEGLLSPWLFVTEKGIRWLTNANFSRVGKTATYLDQVVAELNAKRPEEQQLPSLTAGDFRDAFAAFAYHQSGGMILHVMRALGHKRLSSTQRYLDNSLLNTEGAQIFQTFGNSLWREIELNGRLEPAVIAKWCQDGLITKEQRDRLDDYRRLKRSRLGIGCKDPTRPPRKVAPSFNPDGRSFCSTQRCTLCLENAVILPESRSGLAMRKAELLYIRDSIPVGIFDETSFAEELHNTEVALLGFDAAEVAAMVSDWRKRIASGAHRVVQFETIGKGRA